MKKKILKVVALLTLLFSVSTGRILAQGALCNGTGINTAVGCIPVLGDASGKSFASWVILWGAGVGSGLAFLLILYASFMIMTSQGNPERLKAGQELLTSAISGLLLLIFSVFILNLIGVNILGIFT